MSNDAANILLLLDVLLGGLGRLAEFGSVIAKARQEGRDVTKEELDALSASADEVLAALKAKLDGA